MLNIHLINTLLLPERQVEAKPGKLSKRNTLLEIVGEIFFFYSFTWYFKVIQSDAEPTDTFQMVIDNIWKQRKTSETVYKYLQICYLLPIDYKLIF